MGLMEEVLEMKEEVKDIKKEKDESLAWEMVSDAERKNQRMFTIILVILIMWFCTIGYLVYILNDIGVEATTQEITQDNNNGSNNYIGNNGDIYNGKTEDKAN